jgi:hypothetical protein
MKANRRGPRTELSDAQLHNRRDQLVQLFEADWPRIGRALQQCKEPDHLIAVFSPLKESYAAEILSVFCHTSKEAATGADVRKTRRDLRALVEPSYEADKSKHRASQQLEEINRALRDARRARRRIVQREQEKARKEVLEVEQQSRSLTDRETDLRERRRNLEASFARREILRFVKSKRYELNPVSLANAVANLPYSGWRRSMTRNKRVPSKIGDGITSRIFKAIRFLTALASKQSANTVVENFRAAIPSLPSRHSAAKVELAKNWYFLESAIRQSYKTEKSPNALHFAIAELYFKHVRGANQVDKVVAPHRKIELSKRSKRLSSRRH